jgi:DNA polymerase-1
MAEEAATQEAEEKHRRIAVIDGNSLMHRAYHAIMQPMSAPDGRATNALFGFFNMFIKMVETFKPDGVICAFDKGKPQVRIDMLPQYKAQRPPMDEALHEQFPMVKELLGALDVPVCECEGWEGDDILGTLAKKGEDEGYDMLLFTGDRDMYQLATDHVKIVSTKKGVSDVQIMTPESVDDLYHGITPDLVPDFYGLKGDTSDNIPGVPGIGPKKAAALIVQYGNLDNVVAHAGEVKGKMGENLRAHIDDALLSRKVATIRRDAPIDIDLADAKFPTFDPAEVTKAFSALGFTGLTGRLARLGGDSGRVVAAKSVDVPKASEPAPATVTVPKPLEGDAAASALKDAVRAGGWIGCAVEEDPSAGTLFSQGYTLWVSVADDVLLRFAGDAADAALKLAFAEGHVAAGDVKALFHRLSPVDSSLPETMTAGSVSPECIFDVGVAAYLLESDRSSFEVRGLA